MEAAACPFCNMAVDVGEANGSTDERLAFLFPIGPADQSKCLGREFGQHRLFPGLFRSLLGWGNLILILQEYDVGYLLPFWAAGLELVQLR